MMPKYFTWKVSIIFDFVLARGVVVKQKEN